MPVYEVTSPDGRVYMVEGDGLTPERAKEKTDAMTQLNNVARGILGPAYEPVEAAVSLTKMFSAAGDIEDLLQASRDMSSGAKQADFVKMLTGAVTAGAATLGMVLPGPSPSKIGKGAGDLTGALRRAADDVPKTKPKFPDTITAGPTSAPVTPINSPHVWSETSPDNLHDIMLANKGGGNSGVFVASSPELALGQGMNKGVKVRMRGDFVSGVPHNKPGLPAGGEFKLNYMASSAVDSVEMPKGTKLRKLTQRFLNEGFDKVEEAGQVIYRRKIADDLPMRKP